MDTTSLRVINTHRGQDPFVIVDAAGTAVDGYTSVHGYPQGRSCQKFADAALARIRTTGIAKLDGRRYCIHCNVTLRPYQDHGHKATE
jgi:hypothetical protein